MVPLLDGRLTLAEVQAEVADLFAPSDLETCLKLLDQHNLLEDTSETSLTSETQERLAPQLNFFHETTAAAKQTQQKLNQATVAIVGLNGAGATAAASLAIAGIGKIVGIDPEKVVPADSYLSTIFMPADVGEDRAEVVRQHLAELAPETKFTSQKDLLKTDSDVQQAIQSADFVVCCADAGQSSLVYKLNRVCLETKTNWLVCAAAGAEISVGPLIIPNETACFTCYKMRLVACAENPEDEFAFQRFLDERKQDDSRTRANLIFGTTLAGQLAGLETIKFLTGAFAVTTRSRTIVVNLLDLTMTKHLVLRKPWCPACQPQFHTPPGELDELIKTSTTN